MRITILTILFFTLCTGCSTINGIFSKSNTTATSTSFANRGYDDIPIPTDMTLIPLKSLISNANDGTKIGILKFEGRVEANSLFDTMKTSMQNEGWNPSSYLKYEHFMQVFTKANKDCVIVIDKGYITTTMTIWVLPRSGAKLTSTNTVQPKIKASTNKIDSSPLVD